MKVELIYFDGCPNAEQARSNVRHALEQRGVGAEVLEWERGDPEAPAYIRNYGSPTVLVDGEDVTDTGPGDAGSCRVEGAPSVEAIRAALSR